MATLLLKGFILSLHKGPSVKNKLILVSFSILSLGLSSGCSQSASEKGAKVPVKCIPANELKGIIGGFRISDTDPLSKKVVMLLMKDGDDGKICTGTPISKDMILTAAHCVKGISSDHITAIFHTDITCESGFDFPTMSIKAKDSIFHAGYSEGRKNITNDVALVKLSSNIPESYEVSEVYDGQSTLSSDVVTLAGYGSSDENGEGATYLRTTQKSFKDDIEVEDQKITLQQKYRGICTGDSGGPVFVEVNNKLTIAGVNSYVGVDVTNTMCRSYSVSMYIPYFHDWIQTQLGNLR